MKTKTKTRFRSAFRVPYSAFEMWEKYQEVIAEVDVDIAAQLATMRRQSELPPLPPKPRVHLPPSAYRTSCSSL